MKKNVLTIMFVILGLTGAASAQTMKKDVNPCEAIKGKTYILWSSGKFDDANPDAASGARLGFDRSGKGTSRGFLSFKPTDKSGTHQTFSLKCLFLQDTPNSAKKYYLHFTITGGEGTVGVDAGVNFITSYDNGSKVWVEAGRAGSTMKGWMLQLPPNPPVSDNVVK